ncbi:uncharacterized protein PFL1_04169 [Pseudozyma flocculosa PF-1]|uniref:Xaa-Pro aminopeptidase P n=2 Tax=Pseudozyma flocculosa TaxID=84751 RepID=A0A061H5Y7_9BASI|nr:uncharacterized protein PFL1_04169 [Pseudozyma flocculosa PF-1]EPQ28342.1 hypothetical protein PFL1_04169 [Pseudozyma flocculosa PF-1]SPO35494.1 probable aminopeptidase P, cytoplasmic [Pseudozyma flocculosa]
MGCFSFFKRPSSDSSSTYSERTLIDEGAQHVKGEKALSTTSSKPNVTGPRLEALRRRMDEEACDYYIVPTDDAHGSEYTAPSEQRRVWISNFTGSAGTAVVARDSAHLFADGRYHVQAAEQLDDNWRLHKVGQTGVKDWPAWLLDQVTEGDKVGLDPALISYTEGKSLVTALMTKKAEAVFPTRNLVDVAWGDERPDPIDAPIKVHELKFAGKPAQDKLADVRRDLGSQPANSAFIVPTLDDVAWLLNLRGASVPCNPVFPAYVVVSRDDTALFVSDALLVPGSEADRYVREELKLTVKPYDEVWDYLTSRQWAGEAIRGADDEGESRAKLVSGEKVSYAVVNSVGEDNFVVVNPSPLALRKAVKNHAELAGFRAAHLRDGAAWVRWAAWLEEEVKVKGHRVDEHAAAVEFQRIRSSMPLYAGEAYDAISASGPNAALPHYETPAEGSRLIDRSTPYLNDSGAQYHDGTIDCTRTVHFGRPTHEQKRAYTRVLQGHIALDMATFPAGTTGAQLDCLARQPLWSDGYNYLHGTGHGVGSYLNVHEGPQGFSSSSGGSKTPVALLEGMVLSNEPGFYEEGHFGIRIESLVAVTRVHTHRGFGAAGWFGFERITQVPIATNLVDHRLLTYAEARWLKEHNADVRRKLLPLVKDDRRASRWLRRQ